jgi:hypothetical protein
MIDGILEFTFRPVVNRKSSSLLFSVLMALSAVGVLASVISPKYKGVISLAAIVLICASLFVFVRYMSGIYSYVVMYGSGGEPMLVITKTTGKRVTTLGDFPLSSITHVTKCVGEQDQGIKAEKGIKKYNFCPNLRPAVTYRIAARGRDIAADIIIEGSDEFADRLREYAALARAYEKENED